jgi:RimJ/RimL family protein N-acetyltransferase
VAGASPPADTAAAAQPPTTWAWHGERLRVRPALRQDLLTLLPVYASNAAFLSLTEVHSDYALADLERDLDDVERTPGCHLLAAFGPSDGQAVGVVEVLEQNPADGLPWIGLLMVHGRLQRQGIGGALARGVAATGCAALGWTRVRLCVLDENRPALSFWRGLGFQKVDLVEKDYPVGVRRVWRMELRLGEGGALHPSRRIGAPERVAERGTG